MTQKIYSVLALAFLCSSPVLAKYSGGSGQPNDPYLIATPNDLNSIGLDPCDWDKHFLMTADINMAQITGSQFNVIGAFPDEFSGVFDGNNHSISNFTHNSTEQTMIGIFGYVIDAIIKDTEIINPNILSTGRSDYIGGLAAYLSTGSIISSCSVKNGSVSGHFRVGGLVGENNGLIVNCYTEVNVNGDGVVGGLVGRNNLGQIKNCYSISDVNGSGGLGGLTGLNEGQIDRCCSISKVSGFDDVGGLSGFNDGLLSRCYSISDINGFMFVGGLVGKNEGQINQCFSISDVNGVNNTGGLIGLNYSNSMPAIIDSYASGTVSGQNGIGGLVGFNVNHRPSAIISNCYSSTKVIADTNVGGFVGYYDEEEPFFDYNYNGCFWDTSINPDINGVSNGSDPNVIGLPTAELQKRSTFTDADWDMINAWDIGENQTYPFLRMHLPSDINKDDQTNLLDLAILAQNWLKEQ